MTDVTIIVPVYNVENYLRKCLDSLVKQNYDKNKYEIFIINDASTDSSLSVIEEYANKYKNITFKNLKKNRGVSYARNYGIKHAKGEFLLFCDSDDYYDVSALSKMINFAKRNKSDFVMANYCLATDNANIKIDSTHYYETNIIKEKESICYMTLTSCCKLIKKELFINNNVYYPEDLKKCEELVVIPVLSYLAKKPMILNEYLYYYVQRSESASNSGFSSINDLYFFDESYNRFFSLIDGEKFYDELEFRAIDHLIYGKTLVMVKSHVNKKDVINHINHIKFVFPKFLKNKYLKKYSIAKKIFVFMVYYKLVTGIKFLTFIHKKVTG